MTQISHSIDLDFVRRIAAEVVARLEARTLQNEIVDKIITAQTIESVDHGQTVHVAAKAIVTPAAKDAARERNITIVRGGVSCAKEMKLSTAPVNATSTTIPALNDQSDRQWGVAIEAQLNHRGISLKNATYVLSRQPARDTFEQIGRGLRAASIANLADVDRLSDGFSPQVWVIDIERLTLIETVNLIARIEKRSQ